MTNKVFLRFLRPLIKLEPSTKFAYSVNARNEPYCNWLYYTPANQHAIIAACNGFRKFQWDTFGNDMKAIAFDAFH